MDFVLAVCEAITKICVVLRALEPDRLTGQLGSKADLSVASERSTLRGVTEAGKPIALRPRRGMRV